MFSEDEASETLASLSHEISSAHFTQHPAAFSAGEKVCYKNLLCVISWYRIIKVRVYMHAPRGNLPIARKGVQITDGGAALKGRKITDGGESPRKGTHNHKALKGRQNLYGISVVPSALFFTYVYYRGLSPRL